MLPRSRPPTHNLHSFHAQEVYIFFAGVSHELPNASRHTLPNTNRHKGVQKKRVLNLDGIIEAFDVKLKDYDAARSDLKARITEAYIPGPVSIVGLCI